MFIVLRHRTMASVDGDLSIVICNRQSPFFRRYVKDLSYGCRLTSCRLAIDLLLSFRIFVDFHPVLTLVLTLYSLAHCCDRKHDNLMLLLFCKFNFRPKNSAQRICCTVYLIWMQFNNILQKYDSCCQRLIVTTCHRLCWKSQKALHFRPLSSLSFLQTAVEVNTCSTVAWDAVAVIIDLISATRSSIELEWAVCQSVHSTVRVLINTAALVKLNICIWTGLERSTHKQCVR